jgi:4,5-dihydroxyphthalate decarboxylase
MITLKEKTMTMTETMTLKTAIGPYGHFAALKDGSVKPAGIEFEHVEVAPIVNAFRRMCRTTEFDVSEMAITTYLTAKNYGLPFTAIPVFPVRAFHHNAVVYNVDSEINNPKDVEGEKAGVRAYTVTTGVWARGILASEYGVDWEKVNLILADEEHVEAFHKDYPPNVTYQAGADLAKMLNDNEIQVGIGVGRVGPDSPKLKALIPNARQAAAEWYQKTGIYPINHTVVVKDELLAANPGLAKALYEAFSEAKAKWAANASEDEKSKLSGSDIAGDPFPYGVEANFKAMEAIIGYARDQKILSRDFSVEEVFDASTVKL